jgi:hypothetical protein
VKLTSLSRRVTAVALACGTIAGGAFLASPAIAAPAGSSPGMSIQTTQYLTSSSQADCERARKVAVSLHQKIGDLVSYSSKCSLNLDGKWQATIVFW